MRVVPAWQFEVLLERDHRGLESLKTDTITRAATHLETPHSRRALGLHVNHPGEIEKRAQKFGFSDPQQRSLKAPGKIAPEQRRAG